MEPCARREPYRVPGPDRDPVAHDRDQIAPLGVQDKMRLGPGRLDDRDTRGDARVRQIEMFGPHANSRVPPTSTCPPATTVAGMRFMAGEPMKPATKTFAGRS
jgi:hypothetical protein